MVVGYEEQEVLSNNCLGKLEAVNAVVSSSGYLNGNPLTVDPSVNLEVVTGSTGSNTKTKLGYGSNRIERSDEDNLGTTISTIAPTCHGEVAVHSNAAGRSDGAGNLSKGCRVGRNPSGFAPASHIANSANGDGVLGGSRSGSLSYRSLSYRSLGLGSSGTESVAIRYGNLVVIGYAIKRTDILALMIVGYEEQEVLSNNSLGKLEGVNATDNGRVSLNSNPCAVNPSVNLELVASSTGSNTEVEAINRSNRIEGSEEDNLSTSVSTVTPTCHGEVAGHGNATGRSDSTGNLSKGCRIGGGPSGSAPGSHVGNSANGDSVLGGSGSGSLGLSSISAESGDKVVRRIVAVETTTYSLNGIGVIDEEMSSLNRCLKDKTNTVILSNPVLVSEVTLAYNIGVVDSDGYVLSLVPNGSIGRVVNLVIEKVIRVIQLVYTPSKLGNLDRACIGDAGELISRSRSAGVNLGGEPIFTIDDVSVTVLNNSRIGAVTVCGDIGFLSEAVDTLVIQGTIAGGRLHGGNGCCRENNAQADCAHSECDQSGKNN